MASTHGSQKRYPPELKERAVKMVLEGIAGQGEEALADMLLSSTWGDVIQAWYSHTFDW